MAFLGLVRRRGLDMNYVSYRTPAPALGDLAEGRIEAAALPLALALPQANAGRLRVLAVCNPARSPALPDVPTIGETIKGFGSTPWYGLFAPAGTPKAIVNQLQAAVSKALETPDAKEKLAAVGCEPFKSTPDQFAAQIKAELPQWAKIVKESGATID